MLQMYEESIFFFQLLELSKIDWLFGLVELDLTCGLSLHVL